MRKNKFYAKILIVITLLFNFVLFSYNTVYAFNDNGSIDNETSYETLFGNLRIQNYEVLYNLDDSPDYVLVSFENCGYAIISAYTFEILEYNLTSCIPYQAECLKKYYAGPGNYYILNDDEYLNLETNESITINSETINYARFIRDNVINREGIQSNKLSELSKLYENENTCERNSPDIGDSNKKVILANISSGEIIDNYNYFIVNPTFGNNSTPHIAGNNNTGTCGPVAAQILLSYNNYYNDRRIIANKYLNGYDDATNSVSDISKNPNFCTDPSYMDSYVIGSRSEDTGDNSFYNMLVKRIMDSNSSGSTVHEVYTGMNNYLTSVIGNEYYMKYSQTFLSLFPISSSDIKSEIDADRPIIVSMDDNLGGSDHFVVCYGYQDYTYPDGSGTYSGYVVHFGWLGNNYNKVWINSSWCDGYIILRPNHIHNYNVVTNNFFDGFKVEVRCEECGHRKVDDIFTIYDNSIVSLNYPLSGTVSIPSQINGNTITSISENAFKNYGNITEIIMPNTIIHIGPNAFEDCTYLQSITLSNNLLTIGDSAFKGCSSLPSIIIPNSVTNIDSSAFENCTYLQNITLSNNLYAIGSSAFKGCSSLQGVVLPNSVIYLDSSAFENCTYLQSVILSNNLYAIGTSAFKGCTSLTNINIPMSVQHMDNEAFRNCSQLASVNVKREAISLTNLGTNVFAGCNSSLQITVPMNRACEYKNKTNWVMYKTKIVPLDNNYSEIELHCLSEFYNLTTLSAGYNKLYKLNVECAKSYKIYTSSNDDVKFTIYNSAMNSVATGENTVTSYFGIGTYYLSIEYINSSSSGMIITNYKLVWANQGESISSNTENNVMLHLHQTGNNRFTSKLKYYNSVSGFYKVVLTGYDLNGNEIVYPSGMISIYSDASRNNIMDRYNINNSVNLAINESGESAIYTFLPEVSCYIDICTVDNNFSSLTLNITSIDEISFNYANSIGTISNNNIFENKTDYTYFKQVTISHRSKFILEALPNANQISPISVFILKKLRDPGYEPGDNHYFIEPEYFTNLTFSNGGNELEIILDAGTYYFGYSDNNDMSLIFGLTRLVDYSEDMYNILITDPGSGFATGSEVRFNNGQYRGLTITEGFTRNLFFSQEYVDNTEVSRLDYDWYSSNDGIAEVSKFGTVLAKNVSSNTYVTIYAVNKADPSIVYEIELQILDETNCDEIEIYGSLTYSYQEDNGSYQLELDFDNSPYPYIQYYSWTVNGVTTDASLYWGYVTATGPGVVSLTGIYLLNPRVHLFITLTITE